MEPVDLCLFSRLRFIPDFRGYRLVLFYRPDILLYEGITSFVSYGLELLEQLSGRERKMLQPALDIILERFQFSRFGCPLFIFRRSWTLHVFPGRSPTHTHFLCHSPDADPLTLSFSHDGPSLLNLHPPTPAGLPLVLVVLFSSAIIVIFSTAVDTPREKYTTIPLAPLVSKVQSVIEVPFIVVTLDRWGSILIGYGPPFRYRRGHLALFLQRARCPLNGVHFSMHFSHHYSS